MIFSPLQTQPGAAFRRDNTYTVIHEELPWALTAQPLPTVAIFQPALGMASRNVAPLGLEEHAPLVPWFFSSSGPVVQAGQHLLSLLGVGQ